MGMYCEVSVASREDVDRFSVEPDILTMPSARGRATAHGVSLEKSWHGLHYLLTGNASGGEGPLAFLMADGEQIGEDDDPVRWFAPEAALRIHQALSGISDETLWSRFDADEMTEQCIYPVIWDEDEEELKEEYLAYYHELKQVVAAAAESGQGLLVSIG